MKGIRQLFSCLKITSVEIAGIHSSHEKQSCVQTLPIMNLLYYIQATLLPDIEVKTFQAHTHSRSAHSMAM